ncbi:hypothetical protein Ami103574_12185 [Aminipila butyrica]|uniref:Restriction endonuclease subunit S n=1 Tax=Aminipila butyrica TaxID=433296 RepID=A0A858BY26_9FIRM|nr:hypothetical protein [Aminipila butyrica]QIB70008.1 hypothetical protein Ami103574_12185 [Aminipila butyrica]
MNTAALRRKVLELAVRGRLIPQDPADEPASALLKEIRQEKARLIQAGKLRPKEAKGDSIIFLAADNCHYEQFTNKSLPCNHLIYQSLLFTGSTA